MKKSIFLLLVCCLNLSYQNLFSSNLLGYFYDDNEIKWAPVGIFGTVICVLGFGGFVLVKGAKLYLNSALDDMYTNQEKACLKVAAFCLTPYFLARLMKYNAYSSYIESIEKRDNKARADEADKIKKRWEFFDIFSGVGLSDAPDDPPTDKDKNEAMGYKKSLFKELAITSTATLIGGSVLLYREFNKK